MKSRPVKLRSIAAEQAEEQNMVDRVRSASPKPSTPLKPTRRKPEEAKNHPKRPSPHKHREKIFVSAVIKATERFSAKTQKQASEANVSFDYARRFLAKKAVMEFRTLDLEIDSKGFVKTQSKLAQDIGEFLAKEGDGKSDWHRSRIVLSLSELQAVHVLCNDPLHVLTDTNCVNAVLNALLLQLKMPRERHP